ncbi:MAG: hypothetical protein JO105_13225 [Hyphomicrobiales bacterium]|nr:hypothetical protein [Hyphomicrobiales bacterium]
MAHNARAKAVNLLADAISPVKGAVTWHSRRGINNSLTFEFGKPRLEIREPGCSRRITSARARRRLERRLVFIHGDWHLWLFECEWELFCDGKLVATDRSQPSVISKRIKLVDGQQFLDIEIAVENFGSEITFDMGAKIRTRPTTGNDADQWMLYTPTQGVLTYKGDGSIEIKKTMSQKGQGRWRKSTSEYFDLFRPRAG